MDKLSLRDWWMPGTLRFEDIFGGQTPTARPIGHTLYFSAQPTASAVLRLKQLLSEQRSRELLPLTNARVFDALDGLARRWLDPICPDRRRYLATAEALSGFSLPLISARLEAVLHALRAPSLERRLRCEYGPLEPFQDFWELEGAGARLRRFGPELIGIRAQGVPELALLALVRGLCVRSAVLVQADSETAVLLSLLLQSLAQLERGLAESVALTGLAGVGTTGADETLLRTWLEGVEHLTTWGSDDELKRLLRVAPALPVQPLGRVRSVTVLLRSGLTPGESLRALARGIVRDVVLGTSEAVYSGSLIYVEQNPGVSPEQLAQALSVALVEQVKSLPPTRLTEPQLARQRSTLSLLQVHHAQQSLVLVPPEPGPEGLVVLVPPGGPEVELAPRWIKLVPFRHRPELLPWLAKTPGLHTVALAGEGLPAQLLREDLTRLGVSLFCVPGQRFSPSFVWHRINGPTLPLRSIEEELSLSLEELDDLELAEFELDDVEAEPSLRLASPEKHLPEEASVPAPLQPVLSEPVPSHHEGALGRPRRPAWRPEDDDDDDARESRTVVISVAELERSFAQTPVVAQTGSHRSQPPSHEPLEPSLPEGFALVSSRPPVGVAVSAYDDQQALLSEALRASGQERLEHNDDTLVLTLPPETLRTLEQGSRAFVLPVPPDKSS